MKKQDAKALCDSLILAAEELQRDNCEFVIWAQPLILERFLRRKYLGEHLRIDWDLWESKVSQ